MKHVVVTGGAGFIGSHIVDHFVANGWRVTVIDDLSSGTREQVNPKAKFVQADVRSVEAAQLLRQDPPQALVLAAAQMSVKRSMDDPPFDVSVNLVGLVNLLDALPKNAAEPPFVAFFSTGGVIYGDQREYPAPEHHSIAPKCVYGLSKYTSELYLDFWKRIYGVPFCAVRPGNVYGPRQSPHGEAGVVAIFAKKMLAGESPTIHGDGSITRDYIYVDDVVRAVTTCVERRIEGVFNVGTGIETSVQQIYQHIAVAVGSSAPPAQYGAPRPGDHPRSSISPRKAAEVFNWKPQVTLADGIKKTVAWFAGSRG